MSAAFEKPPSPPIAGVAVAHNATPAATSDNMRNVELEPRNSKSKANRRYGSPQRP
jgi:hypothetical protein